VGIGVVVSVGVGACVAVGVGVEVAVGVGVALGTGAGVSVGVRDAAILGVAVRSTAIDVAEGSVPQAARVSKIKSKAKASRINLIVPILSP